MRWASARCKSQCGSARQGTARLGAVGSGKASHGVERHGVAWQGSVRRCKGHRRWHRGLRLSLPSSEDGCGATWRGRLRLG